VWRRTPAKPKPAITRDPYHRYTYEGQTYPGVTSVLRVPDKSDALRAWASRNTAEAALAQLDEVRSLMPVVHGARAASCRIQHDPIGGAMDRLIRLRGPVRASVICDTRAA
jgi:hypothetical protein